MSEPISWDVFGPIDSESGEAEYLGSLLAANKEEALEEAREIFPRIGYIEKLYTEAGEPRPLPEQEEDKNKGDLISCRFLELKTGSITG